MHGLRPVFLVLSLILVALGLAYAAMGVRGMLAAEPRAGVLLALGAGATVVGALVWRVVQRMRG